MALHMFTCERKRRNGVWAGLWTRCCDARRSRLRDSSAVDLIPKTIKTNQPTRLPPLHMLIEEHCGALLARLLSNPNLLTYEYLQWNGEGDGWSPLGALWRAQRILEDKMLLWQNLPFYGVKQLRKPTLRSFLEPRSSKFEHLRRCCMFRYSYAPAPKRSLSPLVEIGPGPPQ